MSEIKFIMDNICTDETRDYKCYNTILDLITKNVEFRKTIFNGIVDGKISGFSQNLWDKISSQNIRAPVVNKFCEVFKDGYNQGYCTVCSKQVSYSFNNCYLCGGNLPILIGTTNCPNGDHSWIEKDNYIIDTTLMLIIDKTYADNLGYILDNKYNPNENDNYLASKEYANDQSFKRQ